MFKQDFQYHFRLICTIGENLMTLHEGNEILASMEDVLEFSAERSGVLPENLIESFYKLGVWVDNPGDEWDWMNAAQLQLNILCITRGAKSLMNEGSQIQ